MSGWEYVAALYADAIHALPRAGSDPFYFTTPAWDWNSWLDLTTSELAIHPLTEASYAAP